MEMNMKKDPILDHAMFVLRNILFPYINSPRLIFVSEQHIRAHYLRQAKGVVPVLEDSFIKRSLERVVKEYSHR